MTREHAEREIDGICGAWADGWGATGDVRANMVKTMRQVALAAYDTGRLHGSFVMVLALEKAALAIGDDVRDRQGLPSARSNG